MRILYLSPWFPYPLDTGSRTRVYHLLGALAARNQVTLLALDPKGWAPPQREALVSLCEHSAIVHRDPFQRSRLRMATRFLSLRPAVAEPFPEMVALVEELNNREAYDAVIAATTVMADYALAVPDTVRVLEEHNAHTRWMRERYETASNTLERVRCWGSWRKSGLYESHLFRRFDLVTMVSEKDALTSRALLPDECTPVEVYPNAVDCQYYRPGLTQTTAGRLVFGGSLNYYANREAMQFFLERVFPHIRQACQEAHLRITGITEGLDLTGLMPEEGVTLTGFLDDVRPEISSAQAAVVPILSGGGTRLKILEAMALGTPVISTTKGAEGLNAQSGRDILLADDPVDFARAVLRVLEDDGLRSGLAAGGRKLVEDQYDWRAIGQGFSTRVEALVEEHRNR